MSLKLNLFQISWDMLMMITTIKVVNTKFTITIIYD